MTRPPKVKAAPPHPDNPICNTLTVHYRLEKVRCCDSPSVRICARVEFLKGWRKIRWPQLVVVISESLKALPVKSEHLLSKLRTGLGIAEEQREQESYPGVPLFNGNVHGSGYKAAHRLRGFGVYHVHECALEVLGYFRSHALNLVQVFFPTRAVRGFGVDNNLSPDLSHLAKKAVRRPLS